MLERAAPHRPRTYHRRTVVVANRLAARVMLDSLAVEGSVGHVVLTLPGLAARLAGGFVRLASAAEVRSALQRTRGVELTTLGNVATLPGFAGATARTLSAVWHAGLQLEERAHAAPRWAELRALELHVAGSLPPGALLPPELVAAARRNVDRAPVLIGELLLERLPDVPPLYRGLLTDIAAHVPVGWHGLDATRPDWLPVTVTCHLSSSAPTPATMVSCADPEHEALEAVRWAHARLSEGHDPADLAIAAADVSELDDAIVEHANAAGVPLHCAHGLRALTSPVGQVVAALADALERGPSFLRVERLLGAARGAGVEPLSRLPEDWCADIDPGAYLSNVPSWEVALAPAAAAAPEVADIILHLVSDLLGGSNSAATVGRRWLEGDAHALWRRALTDGPPSVLQRSLARLRVPDGTDPATSVLWGPAAQLTCCPRPRMRLLGLSARSWPRRGGDEDPLFPRHMRPNTPLRLLTLPQQDSRDFDVLTSGRKELVVSWPRRGGDGRLRERSHLLAKLPAGELLEVPRAAVSHAATEADRLAARPDELNSDPRLRLAREAYRSAFDPALTRHDGVVRAQHPAVVAALLRPHSATSLRSLILNPYGFVARYALGWSRPQRPTEGFDLDAAALGSLLHEVLQDATTRLAAAALDVADAVKEACRTVGSRWESEQPVPPPVLWRRQLSEVEEWATWSLLNGCRVEEGVESHAELRFGFAARDDAAEASSTAPWLPSAEVVLPGSGTRVRGVIDRLELDRASRHARVIDYKSGRPHGSDHPLSGGEELQRALYAFAATSLLGPLWTVEAVLVHPRQRSVVPLPDPAAAASLLSQAVERASAALLAGNAVAGPALSSPFEDARFAFPAYGAANYLALKAEPIDAIRAELDVLLTGEA